MIPLLDIDHYVQVYANIFILFKSDALKCIKICHIPSYIVNRLLNVIFELSNIGIILGVYTRIDIRFEI